MIVETLSLSMPLLYDLAKTVMGAGSVGIGAYKVIQWIKDIREKDLADMKTGINAMQVGLEKQTVALINEFKEQRQDFRTFYGPLLQSVTTHAVARAKRSPRPKARKVPRKVARKAPKKK
jgi:hypothetical protein